MSYSVFPSDYSVSSGTFPCHHTHTHTQYTGPSSPCYLVSDSHANAAHREEVETNYSLSLEHTDYFSVITYEGDLQIKWNIAHQNGWFAVIYRTKHRGTVNNGPGTPWNGSLCLTAWFTTPLHAKTHLLNTVRKTKGRELYVDYVDVCLSKESSFSLLDGL